VKLLSKLRADIVHKVKNFDLDLIEYLTSLSKSEQHSWKLAITWWSTQPMEKKRLDNWLELFPRTGIQAACWFIVMKSFSESTYYQRAIDAVFHPDKGASPESTNPTE
jgi:hypothetical protein